MNTPTSVGDHSARQENGDRFGGRRFPVCAPCLLLSESKPQGHFSCRFTAIHLSHCAGLRFGLGKAAKGVTDYPGKQAGKAGHLNCLSCFGMLFHGTMIFGKVRNSDSDLGLRLPVPAAVLGERKGTSIAVGMDLVRVRGDENDCLRQKRMCDKMITGSGNAAEQHGIRFGRKPSCAEGCEKGDRKWN